MSESKQHKAGFVNILGNPNVGKSTLMNILVGERMSVINRKPQTTRHRILGIVSEEDYQVVFSDTPGKVHKPQYQMHQAMNRFVKTAYEDADVVLFVASVTEKGGDLNAHLADIERLEMPKFLLLNKIDLIDEEELKRQIDDFDMLDIFEKIFPISAMHKNGTEAIMPAILEYLPEHPAFYPKDQLTDRPERFFVTEMIRDNILELFHQEVPYSCEVVIEDFKEGTDKKGEITRIRALIYVNRKSQKAILIGKGGEAIKRLGTRSRKDIESFLDARVFLDLHIKVRENWRDDELSLRRFGY